MARRSHTKSRRGCFQCKNRHIKCDETHPICVHCSQAQQRCIYPDKSTSHNGPSKLESLPSPHLASSGQVSSVANMEHLRLFHHIRSCMVGEISFVDPSLQDHVYDVFMIYALDCSYLMHQLLALSALHLSVIRPEQYSFFRRQATEMQTIAISLYITAIQDDPKSTMISEIASRFLFASVLGLQVSHEIHSSQSTDFIKYLDDFVRMLRLDCGIRSQIDRGGWAALLETPLAPFIEVGAIRELHAASNEPCAEYDTLANRLRNTEFSDTTSRQACEKALHDLKPLFRLYKSDNPADVQSCSSLTHAWQVSLPVHYLALLEQRNPVALVILAHYGGLLHSLRRTWIVADGGVYLVKSIVTHLGERWASWLIWPNSALASTSPSSLTV